MSRHAGGRVPLAALLALALPAVSGCGHKGAPIPPLPRIPATPREVAVRQRGPRVEIRAGYVLLDLHGRPLRPPVHPEILWVREREPELAAGWLAAFRDREFLRTARVIALPVLADGTPMTREDAVPVRAFPGRGSLVIALALRDARARSRPSPRVVLPVADPPLAPLDTLTATPREDGIALAWTGGDDRAGVVRIYRREQEATAGDWRAWRVVERTEETTLDETARYGQSLEYAATAALAAEDPVVESEPVLAGRVLYEDRFPPDPARDVVGVPVEGGINVLWVPARSVDLAGAIVERQQGDEGAPWREVGRVEMPDAFFTDRDVEPGRRYRYRVISVDRHGNRAAPAGPTAWSSPREPREGSR